MICATCGITLDDLERLTIEGVKGKHCRECVAQCDNCDENVYADSDNADSYTPGSSIFFQSTRLVICSACIDEFCLDCESHCDECTCCEEVEEVEQEEEEDE